MNKKIIRRFVVYPLLSILILFILFLIFQFTLVAEIRELVINVNEQDPIEYGKILFETRSCIGCHAIEADMQNIGPNLYDIGGRMSEDYIRESIMTPDAVVVKGYQKVLMPNFGEILNINQIDALTYYLLTMK